MICFSKIIKKERKTVSYNQACKSQRRKMLLLIFNKEGALQIVIFSLF